MATRIPDNEVTFSPDEILSATSARCESPSRIVTGVVLDSRRVERGNLFVALRGDTHDAHDYVEQAVERGAAAVIVDRDVPTLDADVYRVDDALGALGALAAAHRRRLDVEVVAITGSVGKTTTKELIAAALRGIGRATHATEGNLNNRIGVPMTLFQLTEAHDTAVVEIGMSVPGEIATLAEIARPDLGLVTSVAEVHTEGVGGLAAVAREKGALLTALAKTGTAVWCCDEAELGVYAERSEAERKVGFGESPEADVRLVSHRPVPGHEHAGTEYRIDVEDLELIGKLQLLGRSAAINATAAGAVTWALAPDRVSEALAAMGEVPPHAQRMCPVEAPGDVLVLDDTYNASPRSVEAALETGAALAEARGGRLIAVLGDMLELGALEVKAHEDVGAEAVRVGVGALLLHGERMTAATKGALRAMARGIGPKAKVVVLSKSEDLAPAVRQLADARDVVLVKGSRGMRMERVVEALREEEE